MLFKWFARGLLIAAYVAVCLYAVGVETGPIGWINYAQQSVLGSYSQKLTMLIAIIVSLVVLAPLWWAIDAFGRRLGVPDVMPGPARLAEPPQPPKAKSLLLSSFVAIPLIWIGGYAIWWYQQHQHQQDFQIYLWLASGFNVFYIFIVLVVIAANANHRRRQRKASLRQGGR